MSNQLITELDGLVAWYPHTEGTGTTLHDYSGNGNDGTISGAVWKKNTKGVYTLSYDGSNDYVDLGLSQFGSAFTVMFWGYKYNAWDSGGESNFFEHLDTGTTTGLLIGWADSNNIPNAVIHDGSSWTFLAPSSAPSTDAWHFFAFTKDSSNNVKFYIDSVLEVSGTSNLRTDIDVTRTARYASYYANIQMGDIIVTSTALTQQQIQQIYRKTYRR